MDGSRGPTYGDPPEVHWNDWVFELVHNMLKLFASRCQNVRRFAITQAYLSQSAWDWLLFGEDGRGPPFPKLVVDGEVARNPKIPLINQDLNQVF